MVELPSFLRRSYKFPRSPVVDVEDRDRAEEDEDAGSIPSHRSRHRKWGMAFELSVSHEALLETENASQLLFEFLTHDYTPSSTATEVDDSRVASYHAEEEEEEEEEENNYDGDDFQTGWGRDYDAVIARFGPAPKNKIVWMSDSVVIFAVPCYRHRLHDHFDHGSCKVHAIDFGYTYQETCYNKVRIIVQPPARTLEQAPVQESDTLAEPARLCTRHPSIDSTDAIHGMDLLLRLVAKNKVFCGSCAITAYPQYGRELGVPTEFPASLDVLQALVVVGEVRTDQDLYLQHSGLSLEQWHTVTRNVSKHVPIQIYYHVEDELMERERPAFLEAAIQDHCPAKIIIMSFEQASADKRQLLLSAFEQTTLLEELEITFDNMEYKRRTGLGVDSDMEKNVFFDMRGEEECVALFMDAITRNRSLRRLGLGFSNDAGSRFDYPEYEPTAHFTDAEWESLWNGIASHPTLQDVRFSVLYFGRCSADAQKMLIRMIEQNMVLCKVEIHEDVLFDHSQFRDAINPVLELNRVRQVAKYIGKEADPVHQKQLLTQTLLSSTVRGARPCVRYLLLRSNLQMLEQVLQP